MAALRLQLSHPGLELRHPTEGGAPPSQLLGGMLRHIHKCLTKTHALQDNTSKNKSASQKESSKGIYFDPFVVQLGALHHVAAE